MITMSSSSSRSSRSSSTGHSSTGHSSRGHSSSGHSSTGHSSKRNDSKKDPEAEALTLLKELPGVQSKSELKNWLYKAKVLRIEDEAYSNIRKYIRNSQEHGFGMRVLSIIRIVRNGELEFEHDDEKRRKFRMMLWHGTKTEYIAKILQNGLQNPGDHGQMFGTGIYFADRASKSAQYCPPTKQPTKPHKGFVGYLFLCDVLVGTTFNTKSPRNGSTAPPSYTNAKGEVKNCDSVRCTGKWVPNRRQQKYIKGCVWPIGETVKNKKFDDYTVQYNEYIVYDPQYVKPKYLVKVKFEDQPYLY